MTSPATFEVIDVPGAAIEVVDLPAQLSPTPPSGQPPVIGVDSDGRYFVDLTGVDAQHTIAVDTDDRFYVGDNPGP